MRRNVRAGASCVEPLEIRNLLSAAAPVFSFFAPFDGQSAEQSSPGGPEIVLAANPEQNASSGDPSPREAHAFRLRDTLDAFRPAESPAIQADLDTVLMDFARTGDLTRGIVSSPANAGNNAVPSRDMRDRGDWRGWLNSDGATKELTTKELTAELSSGRPGSLDGKESAAIWQAFLNARPGDRLSAESGESTLRFVAQSVTQSGDFRAWLPLMRRDLERDVRDSVLRDSFLRDGMPPPRGDRDLFPAAVAASATQALAGNAAAHPASALAFNTFRHRGMPFIEFQVNHADPVIPVAGVHWVSPFASSGEELPEPDLDTQTPEDTPAAPSEPASAQPAAVARVEDEIPMQTAELVNYLPVDWGALEARLKTLAHEIEDFGAATLGEPTPRTSLFWVTIVVSVGSLAVTYIDRNCPQLALAVRGTRRTVRTVAADPARLVDSEWEW